MSVQYRWAAAYDKSLASFRRLYARHATAALLIAVVLFSPCLLSSEATAEENGRVRSGYAVVDDISLYYELRGAGEPIFMLHGGFGSTAVWAACAEQLAKRFLVITTDARGRGRTSDGSGPTTAGRTARDVIGLMDHFGIKQANVVGHSAGSLTTIHLLIDYPDRVRSGTLVGSPLVAFGNPNDALRKQMGDLEALRDGQPKDDELKEFAEQWRRVAPDPSRFRLVMEKLNRGMGTSYSESALAAITRPVLVVKAGRDRLVPPEAFDRLATSIRGSKLIVFSEGTHGLPRQDPTRLAEEIQRFIEAQGPSIN